jgi:cysteinyl-tRNA synthetase
MNITDVGHLVSDGDTGEDKMEKGARRTGKSAWEIAAFYAQAFKDDLRHLNIVEPTIWCRATDHIREQIETIQWIEAKGFTYRTADGIYFDTSQLPTYGYLARLHSAGLQAGRRVDIGDKRHPTDFALWKFSPAGQQRQMEWESPWGVGFPGWHIECSAMSAKYLGTFFDLHCGERSYRRASSMKLPRPRPAMAHTSPTSGSMDTFSSLTTPRWRSQWGTSCACRRCWRMATSRWRIASFA